MLEMIHRRYSIIFKRIAPRSCWQKTLVKHYFEDELSNKKIITNNSIGSLDLKISYCEFFYYKRNKL